MSMQITFTLRSMQRRSSFNIFPMYMYSSEKSMVNLDLSIAHELYHPTSYRIRQIQLILSFSREVSN